MFQFYDRQYNQNLEYYLSQIIPPVENDYLFLKAIY
jgi:hypothetical protein